MHQPQPAAPDRSPPAGAIDRLEDIRILAPLLGDRPHPAALAARLLERFGSLARVVHATPAQLNACDAAAAATAPRLHALADLHGALLRAELETVPLLWGRPFTSGAYARRFAASLVGNRDREVVGALVLTARLHLLRHVVIAEGTYDRAACYVREVARLVVDNPTPGIILYHGHPSGDPTPSRADWALTEAVRDALGTLEASLFDHIVCAGAATVSMAELEPGRFDPCDGRTQYLVDE